MLIRPWPGKRLDISDTQRNGHGHRCVKVPAKGPTSRTLYLHEDSVGAAAEWRAGQSRQSGRERAPVTHREPRGRRGIVDEATAPVAHAPGTSRQDGAGWRTESNHSGTGHLRADQAGP